MSREVRHYGKVCSEPTFLDTKIKFDLEVARQKKTGIVKPKPTEPKFLVRMRSEKELYPTEDSANFRLTRPLSASATAPAPGSAGSFAPPILNPAPPPRPTSPMSPKHEIKRKNTGNSSASHDASRQPTLRDDRLTIAGLKRQDSGASISRANPADSVQSSPGGSTS
jgi:hypothetical protein